MDQTELDLTDKLQADKLLKPALSTERAACLVVMEGQHAGRPFKLDAPEMVIGRARNCHIMLTDSGISRMHAQLSVSPECVTLEDLDSTNGVYVGEEKITSRQLEHGDTVTIGTAVLKFMYEDLLDVEVREKLYESATKDGLTGAHNKKHFMTRFATEVSYSKRHSVPLSLIMFDADHFKQVNDTKGHPAGDAVLKELSARVQKLLRTEDIFSRYGGEEFAILMWRTEQEGASILAERIRESVANTLFTVPTPTGNEDIPVTISLGVASWDSGSEESLQGLIQAADLALYQSKQGGRNRVSIYRPGP